MAADHRLHDRQPEPGALALRLGGEERVEDPREHLGDLLVAQDQLRAQAAGEVLANRVAHLRARGACALGAPGLAQTITPAPAFTADALTALPVEDWVTNGGNLYNQRYSPLDQINPETVSELKGVWRTSLDGSGVGPGYSAEAQVLVHEGVIYVVTGDNDVFAVDVETGGFHWVYEADIDFDIAAICCGRLSRGLGMGDGKIFLGKIDGRLTALDQTTGEIVWETLAADPRDTTVSNVALDHGFHHLSRFASTYRTAFGELPSQTLSRRR